MNVAYIMPMTKSILMCDTHKKISNTAVSSSSKLDRNVYFFFLSFVVVAAFLVRSSIWHYEFLRCGPLFLSHSVSCGQFRMVWRQLRALWCWFFFALALSLSLTSFLGSGGVVVVYCYYLCRVYDYTKCVEVFHHLIRRVHACIGYVNITHIPLPSAERWRFEVREILVLSKSYCALDTHKEVESQLEKTSFIARKWLFY